MSIFLPKGNYKKGVVYFVTTTQIESMDALDIAFNADTAIFVVNLRNGVFGYFHEGLVDMKHKVFPVKPN